MLPTVGKIQRERQRVKNGTLFLTVGKICFFLFYLFLCTFPYLWIEQEGAVLCRMGSVAVRSEAEGEFRKKKDRKKPSLQTVCFCQLRDAAKGSRELGGKSEEKGGRQGGSGRRGEERGKKKPSAKPSS